MSGETMTCYYCTEEFPASKIKVKPPGAQPGQERRFCCVGCEKRIG